MLIKCCLSCEHASPYDKRNTHLLIRSLLEFDIEYLSALFDGDDGDIREHEEKARSQGYGPLAPCSAIVDASQTAIHCGKYHYFLSLYSY